MKNRGTKFRYLLAALFVLMWSSCVRDFFDHFNGNGNGNGSTIRDIDGNVYTPVKIGEQTWMVENLKVTHYNDGSPINYRLESATPGIGYYAWYNNDLTLKNTYGALYEYNAYMSGKLAPKGWHVPDMADWKELIGYLGGEQVAGNKMQESGNAHWITPNPNATNESGFTALPGGYWGEGQGIFGFLYLGYQGAWAQSSWIPVGEPHPVILFDNGSLGSAITYSTFYFSVRCLKNTIPKLTTASITEVTSSSAKSGGLIKTNGGSKIKTAGICWNTSPNPTVNNFKTVDPTRTGIGAPYEPDMGLGPFTSTITGLQSATTYYLRAYAVNDIGTAYGQEISFVTP